MTHTQASSRPTIALAMGDPSGISLELTAKLMADADIRAAANYILIGERRALEEGCRIAKVTFEIEDATGDVAECASRRGAVLVDHHNLDPLSLTTGSSSKGGGLFALSNFRNALRFGAQGTVDAVAFTPFNKHAMRLADGSYVDEIEIISQELGGGPGREFNVLGGLWNARITSHVPISKVASLITKDAIVNGLMLTDRCMRDAGFERPRIAVAALNPHAGDGGNFGHEDDDEIVPAVAEAKARGIICEGPFPSDTVFLRARRGDFDAVQTMYHDQGQIAMKLMGFESGVTLIGGYKVPVCTPAHGTAYDIAGMGTADIGASKAALLLAARLAVRNRQRTAAH